MGEVLKWLGACILYIIKLHKDWRMIGNPWLNESGLGEIGFVDPQFIDDYSI